MSFCLILLAAGNSKRFGSKIPKPFIKIGEKTLLEYSLKKFNEINEIKKTVIVINKKHKKFINKISSFKFIKLIGGNTRQESTLIALRYLKKNKIRCKNVLIHDAAIPNFSMKLIKKIINFSKKNNVIPRISINDALKERVDNKSILNLSRNNFFLTQTPQSFDFNEIFNLHLENKFAYKDDDLSLAHSLKD